MNRPSIFPLVAAACFVSPASIADVLIGSVGSPNAELASADGWVPATAGTTFTPLDPTKVYTRLGGDDADIFVQDYDYALFGDEILVEGYTGASDADYFADLASPDYSVYFVQRRGEGSAIDVPFPMIPEPSTAALLLLMAPAVMRRRRTARGAEATRRPRMGT